VSDLDKHKSLRTYPSQVLHTHENKARESFGIPEVAQEGHLQQEKTSTKTKGKPHRPLQPGSLVYNDRNQEWMRKGICPDTHWELPISFINTLTSLVPAKVPLGKTDVVNSRAPMVCLRLRATRFWYNDEELEDKERFAASDIILVSKVLALLSAEE